MATPPKKKRNQRTVYVKQKEDTSWHLDRRVPLALIFAMILQGAAILTWANGISYSISQFSVELAEVKKDIRESQSKFDSLTVLNADMRNLVQTVGRLERYMERYEFTHQNDREMDKKANKQ